MPADSNGLDFSKTLKSKTQGCLDRLDFNEMIMDPLISIDAYKEILANLYLLLSPMEDQIAALPGWQGYDIQIEPRLRSRLLQEDILHLGDHLPASHTKVKIPRYLTLSHGFGALYVLEEPTFRGDYILRHLTTTLGITADKGGRYFYGYGKQTPDEWSDFCRILNSYAVKNQGQRDDIINAACATYFVFEKYMRHL